MPATLERRVLSTSGSILLVNLERRDGKKLLRGIVLPCAWDNCA